MEHTGNLYTRIMNEATKGRIQTWIGLIALGTAVSGYIALPGRMSATEEQIKTLEQQIRQDHDLLIRIDANVAELKERAKR